MLPTISEEELDFFECFYDSQALAECLISDVDNPSVFEEDKNSEVRIYQLPMISFEYAIDDENPSLNKKENFQMRINAGTIYAFGGRKYGKCESVDNEIQLADGSLKRLGDLIGQERRVVSFNDITMKLDESIAIFRDNGEKDCIEIVTCSGKKITVTENHPLLTEDGWLFAERLKVGMSLAVPRVLPELGKEDVDENIAKLLGHLIADGGCTNTSISYTKMNPELVEEYKELAEYFGCDLRHSGISYYAKGKIAGKGKNQIMQLVREYGIDKLSREKTMPEQVFKWKNKYIALLLNRYFAGDGHRGKCGARAIELCSTSPKMLEQVQQLLLRFGIKSKIYKHRLSITEDSDLFLDTIGMKSKDDGIRINKTYSTGDLIPSKLLLKYSDELYGKIKKSRMLRYDGISRFRLEPIAETLQDGQLKNIINSDVYWDTIKEVNLVGKKSTVMVEVPHNNTYISNGIISHNSIFVEVVDLIVNAVVQPLENIGFSSFDAAHIMGILEPVCRAFEVHPFLKMYKPDVKRSPNYRITLNTGWRLVSINQNHQSKNPGDAWFQQHFNRIYIEESSKECQGSFDKRQDAVSENGAVHRVAGMTDFTKYSPAGTIYYDQHYTKWLCGFPQYVSPFWDEAERQKQIKKYSGLNSVGFRVYVDAKIVEEGISVFDMERVNQCFDRDRMIKHYEITKKTFSNFESILATVERNKSSEVTYICGDIGESAPTEIMILDKVGDKFRYEYQITLYGLTDEEQYIIFLWLFRRLQAGCLSIDCGDGSIDENEFVMFKRNGSFEYSRAHQLPSIFNSGDAIEAPTWNSGKLEWKPCKLFSHPYQGNMLRIGVTPSSGYVRVTPNHSMLVYENNDLRIKSADALEIGDWVVSPKLDNLDGGCKEHSLDFLGKQLPLNEDMAYFLGWICAEGSSRTGCYQLSLGEEYNEAQMLVELYSDLFKKPAKARIITAEYVNSVSNKNRLFKGNTIQSDKDVVRIDLLGGKRVVTFFESLVGKGSHNKRIPLQIFSSTNEIKLAFLNGLLGGDGTWRKKVSKTGKQTTEWAIKVASEELVYGVGLLLKQLGIFGTFNTLEEFGITSYVISWTDDQKVGLWKGIPYSCIPMKNGKSREDKKVFDVKALIKNRISKEKLNRIESMLDYDFMFRRVSSIESYEYSGMVYDLMVDDNNTFIAGVGDIVIHNTGRSTFRRLEKVIPKEKLVWYAGAEKIQVDVERDDNNNIVFKNGKPVPVTEYMAEWAVKHLKDLFYDNKLYLLMDNKLHEQVNSVVATISGNRTVYHCLSKEDHLFDAFKVFSIAHWYNEFNNTNAKNDNKEFDKTGV